LHKIVVLYPPQADPEKFKAYYVAKHIPLVRKLPGIKALRYTFDVASPPGAPASPYFCVFEAEFADIAAFGAAMGSPEGAAVAADGPNYASAPPVVIHYSVDASM
jgi:uncharacterized protein (TIGR02118 family)